MKNISLTKAVLCSLSAVFLCQVTNAEPVQPNGVSRIDSCDSITGLYRIAGEYLPNPSLHAKVRMDWTLFLKEVGGKPTGIELTWNSPSGVMSVKVLGEDLFPPESESYSINASCIGGEIIYEVEHDGYSEGGSKNNADLKARLSKDGMGNLILNGQIRVESTELLIFRSSQEAEINARFFPK